MDTFLAIASKRDARAYAPDPLPADAVERILQAGRVTGSARNRQEWRFHVVDQADVRERISAAVTRPSNILGAPVAIAVTVHGKGSLFDAGRAAQNMMLAAANDGLVSCPNSPKDREALAALLGLEADEEIAIILSFGYPERPRRPERRTPQEWLERADRKPLAEVARRL